jgi:diguanylate cyclase (GGDEF)-like protein
LSSPLRVAAWSAHALLLAVSGLISWAVNASGEAGSPYTVFFVWVAISGAWFLGRWSTARRLSRVVDRLTEIGRVDSLTGLYNGTAFTEMLDNEIERARRSGSRLGVVVAELDEFAPVSSGPMPPAQQELLRSVGAIFRASPRQIDMCARIGAGRFAMLLPYTDEHGAFLLAERIRERVAPLMNGRAHMSFGIAGFPRAGATAQMVFQAAEVALAEAHEQGGDRIVVFQRSGSSAQVEIQLPEAPEPQLG